MHLDSHLALVDSLSGQMSTEMKRFARIFVESHDLGYSLNFTDPDFESQYKNRLIDIWTAIGLANGYEPSRARGLGLQTYDTIAAAASEKNLKSYMVPKVLAHGTTSILLAMDRLRQAGFTEKEALGLALLFAPTILVIRLHWLSNSLFLERFRRNFFQSCSSTT